MSFSAFGDLYIRVRNLELNPPGFSQGVDGNTGATGITGATGVTGDSGTTLTGSTGSSGAHGISGETGTNGIRGSTGETGTNGTTGEIGSNGSIGENAFPGNKGQTGQTGAGGFLGQLGYPGNPGALGEIGTFGEIGSVGFTGFTGATGTAGSGGENGDIGQIGENGSNGQQGLDGITGTMGPTGEAGNSNSEFNYLLNLDVDQPPIGALQNAVNGYLGVLEALPTGTNDVITLYQNEEYTIMEEFNVSLSSSEPLTLETFITYVSSELSPNYSLEFYDSGIINEINSKTGKDVSGRNVFLNVPELNAQLQVSNVLVYALGGGGSGGGNYGGKAGGKAYGAVRVTPQTILRIKIGSGGEAELYGRPTVLEVDGVEIATAEGGEGFNDTIGEGESGFGGGGGGGTDSNGGLTQVPFDEFGNFPTAVFCSDGEEGTSTGGKGGDGGFYFRFYKRYMKVIASSGSSYQLELTTETSNNLIRDQSDLQTSYSITDASWNLNSCPTLLKMNTYGPNLAELPFYTIQDEPYPGTFQFLFRFKRLNQDYVQRIPGFSLRFFNNSPTVISDCNYEIVEPAIQSKSLSSGKQYRIVTVGTTDWYFVIHNETESPPGTTTYNIGDEFICQVPDPDNGSGTASEIVTHVKPQEGLTLLWKDRWIILPVIVNMQAVVQSYETPPTGNVPSPFLITATKTTLVVGFNVLNAILGSFPVYYEIQYDGQGSWTSAARVGNIATATLTGLVKYTSYDIYGRVRNSFGNISNTASISTLGDAPSGSFGTQNSVVTTSSITVYVDTSGITLGDGTATWQVGYNSDNSNNYTYISAAIDTENVFGSDRYVASLTGLSSSTTRYFRFRVYNTFGEIISASNYSATTSSASTAPSGSFGSWIDDFVGSTSIETRVDISSVVPGSGTAVWEIAYSLGDDLMYVTWYTADTSTYANYAALTLTASEGIALGTNYYFAARVSGDTSPPLYTASNHLIITSGEV